MSQKRIFSYLCSLFFIVWLGIFSLFLLGEGGFFHYLTLQKEIQIQRSHRLMLEAENDAMHEAIYQFQTSESYVQGRVRESYNLIAPGEILYHFSP